MADAAKQIGSKPANFAKFPLILEFFHAGEIVGELIRTSLEGYQYQICNFLVWWLRAS
jgi:hypothetical protein